MSGEAHNLLDDLTNKLIADRASARSTSPTNPANPTNSTNPVFLKQRRHHRIPSRVKKFQTPDAH